MGRDGGVVIFFLRESSFSFPSTDYSIITGNHLSSKIMTGVAGGGGGDGRERGWGRGSNFFARGWFTSRWEIIV